MKKLIKFLLHITEQLKFKGSLQDPYNFVFFQLNMFKLSEPFNHLFQFGKDNTYNKIYCLGFLLS